MLRRAAGIVWVLSMCLVGLYAGVSWGKTVIQGVLYVLDQRDIREALKGVTLGSAIAVALIAIGWSIVQLRNGWLSRLIVAFGGRRR